MQKIFQFISGFILFISMNMAYTQTPSDALFMKKNELCFALQGSTDNWNMYWEGNLYRENLNIGKLSRNSILPMLAYGITDRLNFMIMIPYVKTEPSGGQMVGASGWQDLSLFMKYRLTDHNMGLFNFQSFLTGGYSLPASGYLSDYMPFSLGLGTNEWSMRAIFKAEYKDQVYFRGSAAYLHRTTTEAERNYYYADKGYYTTTMDVPDASNIELALGGWIFKRSFQAEISHITHTSLSGDDIRRQNQPQPTNRMSFTSFNTRLRYFAPFAKGFSIFANYTDTLSGQNIGDSTVWAGGITYQFYVKKSHLLNH